jgi:hypothetical protein
MSIISAMEHAPGHLARERHEVLSGGRGQPAVFFSVGFVTGCFGIFFIVSCAPAAPAPHRQPRPKNDQKPRGGRGCGGRRGEGGPPRELRAASGEREG